MKHTHTHTNGKKTYLYGMLGRPSADAKWFGSVTMNQAPFEFFLQKKQKKAQATTTAFCFCHILHVKWDWMRTGTNRNEEEERQTGGAPVGLLVAVPHPCPKAWASKWVLVLLGLGPRHCEHDLQRDLQPLMEVHMGVGGKALQAAYQ